MTDPKIAIKALLISEWDDDNTSSVTPTFSTGWYDAKSKHPQVTLTDPSEVPQSRGPAPFLGIATNGAPAQLFVCSLACNVWVTRPADRSYNPKEYVYEMKEEIKRILLSKYADVTDLDYVAWLGGNEVVDDTVIPAVFRFIGEIGYAYLATS